MSSSTDVWVRRKLGFYELQNASVQFRLRTAEGGMQGYGIFKVRQTDEGLLRIKIVITTAPNDWSDPVLVLRQDQADAIRPHPEQIVANYYLEA